MKWLKQTILRTGLKLSRGNTFLPRWQEQLGLKFRIPGDFATASTNPTLKVFVAPV
jgi:hypothetical protein